MDIKDTNTSLAGQLAEKSLFIRLREAEKCNNKEKVNRLKTLILNDNIALCHSISSRFKNISEDYSELLQASFEGLSIAINKFDISFNVKFSTYAFYYIRQAVYAAVSEETLTSVPVSLRRHTSKVIEIISDYEHEQGRAPTVEYISECTGLSIQDVDSIIVGITSIQSLNALVGDGEGGKIEFIDSIACTNDPYKSMSLTPTNVTNNQISEYFNSLSSKQLDILMSMFSSINDKNITFIAISKKLGLSRERVRQVYNDTMDGLFNTSNNHFSSYSKYL